MNEEPAGGEVAWNRLDRGTVKVSMILLAGVALLAGVPTSIGLASWQSFGFAMAWVLPGAVVLVGGAGIADYLRWRKTWYRVLPDTVEVRKGIVFVSRRRLGRERIRAVDLSAHAVLRMFGLVKLTLGTGEQGGGGSSTQTLVLDPIPRDVGEQLRAVLLDQDGDADEDTQRLATWQPSWTWYAPLSITTIVLAAAVVGATFQVSDWFGQGGLPVEITMDLIATYGVWPVVAAGVLVVLVGAVLAAVGFYLELWFNYRLERQPGGTLRVTRGLLTSRSLSLEEQRIRGVDLIEPLGVRLADAARVQVVATGLSSDAETSSELSTLLPAAPRHLALDVAEQVSGQSPAVALLAHPKAAFGRRLRWALLSIVATVLVCAVLLTLTSPPAAWTAVTAGVVAAVAVALVVRAWDSARNLGHALTSEYLIARRGSIRRSTVLLRRSGIIGWRVRQSVFQRRAGLATLTAISAAGRGRYPVVDADAHEILDTADAAVPELLKQFLVSDPVATPED